MAKSVNPTNNKPKVIDKNSDAFDRAARKVDIKYAKDRQFDVSKMTASKVNLSQTDYDRYLTYDSKTFGKLGFDITRDNAEYYNLRTTNSQELARSTKGFFKLAGVGFQDTVALGSIQSKDSSKKFADIMQDYSIDNRRDVSFWGNTWLSAGYTAGIIGAVAAEELALGALTGGAGLFLTGGKLGRGLNTAFTKLGSSKLARIAGGGRTHLEVMQDLSNIERAQEAYQTMNFGQKVAKGAKEFGTDILKGLNPVGNTATFLKDLDKMSDINGLVKTVNGAGALYRDARKFTMTHGESRLEADMNRDEYLETRTKELKAQNGGAPLSDEQMDLLRVEADKVRTQTYMGNFGLIYATNAIAFDNIFRNMKFNNNWLRSVEAGRNTMRNIGKANASFVTENLGINLGRGFKNWTIKTFNPTNLARVTLGNYAEGFQELEQDAIAQGAQAYVRRTKPTKQNEGGYFNTLFNDLSDHVDFVGNDLEFKFRPKDGQEGTTFWAGALMGFMASPVSMITQGVQKFALGKGYRSLSKSYREQQDQANLRNEKIAKILNATFQANLDKAYDVINKPLFQQVEIQEKLEEAIKEGDIKKVKDYQDKSFTIQAKMLIDSNADGDMVDHLEALANKADIQTLNEALKRTDITEDNVEGVRANLKGKALTLRKLRAVNDEINQNFVDPINPRLLSKKDPQYFEKYHKYQASQELKKELLFSNATILNNLERTKSIEEKIANASSMLDLNSLDKQALLSTKEMDRSIELLNTEIKSIKDINSSRPESKKELATLQERLNALKALKEGISEAKKASDKGNIDSIEEMYDQVNRALLDYASTFTPKFRRNPELLNDVVESVFDYHMLTKDNEHLQDHINFLNNPEYANRFMDAAEKSNKSKIARLEAQIKDSLDAFEERKKASKLMQILTEKGLIFDMNEIDDLVERGIMPSRIYNAVTNKRATPEEEAEVHRIIEAIYKNVKNKKIANDKSSITRAGAYRAEKDNRTVKEIIREYRLKMDEDIDLSTPSGKSLIKRVLKSGNLRATDVEILEELLDKGGVIRFVTNAEMPITFKDGVTTIDLRFAGSEFRNTRLSFEGLFTVALLQDKVAKKVISDPEFAGEVTLLMQQAKEAATRELGQINDGFFNDPVIFLVEAMNNRDLQRLMQRVNDDSNIDTKSLWFTLSALIKRIIKATLNNKTLVDRAVYLTKVAVTDGELIKAEEVIDEEEVVEPLPPLDFLNESAEQEEEEPIDREDFLRNEIADKKAELQRYQTELSGISGSKLNKAMSFRKASRLKNLIAKLNIEINDLTLELNEYVPAEEQVRQAPFIPVNREADTDIYGNIILNENAPFKALPTDVVNELNKIYGKDIMNLTEFEQEQVRTIIAENPVVIKMLKEHNENTFAISDENRILLENEKTIEDAKILREKRKQQWQESIDEGKAQRKQNAVEKAPTSNRDILMLRLDKAGLPFEDIELLTNKQVDKLFTQLRAKEITISDVFEVIQRKKLLKQQRAQKKYDKEMAEMISIELDQEEREKERLDKVGKTIKNNRELLAKKNIYDVITITKKDNTKKEKPVKVSVPRSHVVFYETYFPELLLMEDKVALINQIKTIKQTAAKEGSLIVDKVDFTSNKLESLNKLVDLFIELDSQKRLFPTAANKINKKLRASGLPFRITMAKTKKGEQLIGTMYKIRLVEPSVRAPKAKKEATVESAVSKAQKREVALRYQVIGNSELDKELLALQFFLGGGRVTKEFIESQVTGSEQEIETRRKRSFISPTGKGSLDTIFEDNELLKDVDNSEKYGIEVLKNHNSISEMIETAFDIVKALNEEYNEQQKRQAENAAGEELNVQIDTANEWESYMNSEEGKQYLEDMYKDEQDYFLNETQQETALIEFYASEEGQKYFEEYHKYTAKYLGSDEFKAEMGVKEEKSEESKEEEQEQEESKPEVIEEYQLNEDLMNDAETLATDLLFSQPENSKNKPRYIYYNTAVKRLDEKPTLLNLIVTLAAFRLGKLVTTKQMENFSREMVNKISRFSTDNSNEILIINNKAYRVLPGLLNRQVQLQELNTTNVMTATFEDLPLMVSDVVTIGESVKSKDGLSFENKEDFKNISNSLLNVFNNFGKFMKEGIAIPEDEQSLKNEIIEKLNTCK